jgi:hypothetical protein
MDTEILIVNKFAKTLGLLVCALVALSGFLMADSITLSGVLDAAGQVNLHSISVSQTDLITFTTTPGPFDAALSIFDAAGHHLITNDDSPSDDVNTIPRITILLGPGNYTVAVSACCAFANASDLEFGTAVASTDGYNLGNYWIGGSGTLSDGFTQYSCEGTCFGPYRAPVASALDSTTITAGPVTSVTATPVPEPGSLLLLATGLLGLTGLVCKSGEWKSAAVLSFHR